MGFVCPITIFPTTICLCKGQESLGLSVLHRIERNLALPLSLIASAQWETMDGMLNGLELSDSARDHWAYIWGDNTFTSKKAYKTINGSSTSARPFTCLWQSACRSHHKFLFWLLLQDRLNTRNLLRRKNRDLPSYDCVLCARQIEETSDHLFFTCAFSQWCWSFMNLPWNLNLELIDHVEQGNSSTNNQIYKEQVTVGCWAI